MIKHCNLEHAFTDPAHMVEVDGRAHQGPCDEQRFCCIDAVLVKNDPLRCQVDVPDQAMCIDRAVQCPGIVHIAEQVIHPVYIEIAVDDSRETMASFHNCAQIGCINSQHIQLRAELRQLRSPRYHRGLAEPGFHQRFACMGKRAVTHVMEESRDQHHAARSSSAEPELPAGDTGQMHRSYRMFKTSVVSTGIHQVGESQLADVPQPLNRWRVKERQDLLIHFHIAMDRILDDLGIH